MSGSGEFTRGEWGRIRRELDRDPLGYGLPEREYGSVLIASFNIRKLGKLRGTGEEGGRDTATMRFLADVCRRFDLLAVQEIMPEMAAARRLRELMGDDYGLMVSDIVGTFPGESGNEERLGFIYNRSVIRRTELVTEVTTSRTKVLKSVAKDHKDLFDTMESNATAQRLRKYYLETLPKYREDVRLGSTRRPPKMPAFKVSVDTFLQFIRTPFAASFEVRSHPGLENYRFLAVNAHLHFGRPADRKMEAAALIEWILGKVRSGEATNTVLLGDLNFDFDNPRTDMARIQAKYEELGGFDAAKGKEVFVSFPFIFPHPRPAQKHPEGQVFRSNIGQSQTYDQIGIFSSDERLRGPLETTVAGHSEKEAWGLPTAPDYGVFNFADLFSRTINDGKSLSELTRDQRQAFLARFEHKVSDHMPIWFRMPLPRSAGGFPTQT